MTTNKAGVTLLRFAAIAALGLSLGACNVFQRLADIGKTPEISEVQNPTQAPGYRPITMPMPQPVTATRQANSLWLEGSRAFFKDQRAAEVGDIITVVVSIADEAAIDNRTRHDRTRTDDLDVNGLFGAENLLSKALPGAPTGADLLNLNSSLANDGRGRIDRTETINLRVAGVITQRLPNGNLVVFGRQEVRVNFEVREIVVGGVLRPADISTQNTIKYDQMAEARISYGGRGQLTDLQQQRYGAQALEILMPF